MHQSKAGLNICLIMVVMLITTGCVNLPTARNISGMYGVDEQLFSKYSTASSPLRKQLSLDNRKILQEEFGHEWQYNRNKEKRNQPPQLGLALSGGGPRSASFSIGVLKALQNNGVLDNVDVISAVSGGAYATYWYYMQNCYLNKPGNATFCPTTSELSENYENVLKRQTADFTPGSIFTTAEDLQDHNGTKQTNITNPDNFRFQETIGNSSNILSFSKEEGLWRSFRNGLQFTWNFGAHIVSIPLHWTFNGLAFDWDANLNPTRHVYQNGIERTYGYVPLSYDLEHFANAESLLWMKQVDATQVKFTEMAEYLTFKNKTEKSLPYFIINASATYSRGIDKLRDNTKHLNTSVFEFTPWKCGSGLIGYYDIEKCPDISFSRAVSISGAAVDGQSETIDRAGKSNGPNPTLAGLGNLFNADLGYHVTRPDVNRFVWGLHKITPFPVYFLSDLLEGNNASDIYLTDGGHIENLGMYSLIRRGVSKIIAVDAEQDQKSVFEGLMRLKENLKNDLGLLLELDQPNGPIKVKNSPTPQAVITGRIRGLVDENGKDKPIELLYLKLSMDPAKLQAREESSNGKYPFSVSSYQSEHPAFPHESTTDIKYSPEQYRAYRDLGYTIANSPVLTKFTEVVK